MSALGLLCLSLDNVLAIVAPFFYERLSIRPLSIRILIGCLWTGALTLAIVIRLCGMHKSVGVQVRVQVHCFCYRISIYPYL